MWHLHELSLNSAWLKQGLQSREFCKGLVPWSSSYKLKFPADLEQGWLKLTQIKGQKIKPARYWWHSARTWTRPLQKKPLYLLPFSAATTKVNSLKRTLFLLSSSYLVWQWTLGCTLWEQNHLSQINLTWQWDCSTAGWSRGRSWIVLFSTCTRKARGMQKTTLVKSEGSWGFFRFAKVWKIFTPKPLRKQHQVGGAAHFLSAKSVYRILLWPKRLFEFAFSWNT